MDGQAGAFRAEVEARGREGQHGRPPAQVPDLEQPTRVVNRGEEGAVGTEAEHPGISPVPWEAGDLLVVRHAPDAEVALVVAESVALEERIDGGGRRHAAGKRFG